MLKVISCSVKDKIARAPWSAFIVSDNVEQYAIEFSFDAEWSLFDIKTARFLIGGEYVDVDFSGDVVGVPLVPSGIKQIRVGVYAGNLSTTTPAQIRVIDSVLADQPASIYDPDSPDVLPAAEDVTLDDLLHLNDVSAGRWVKATIRQILAAAGAAPQPSDDDPEPNGEASPGESDEYSRADHMHPEGKVVKYEDQTLTFVDKMRARNNIDALYAQNTVMAQGCNSSAADYYTPYMVYQTLKGIGGDQHDVILKFNVEDPTLDEHNANALAHFSSWNLPEDVPDENDVICSSQAILSFAGVPYVYTLTGKVANDSELWVVDYKRLTDATRLPFDGNAYRAVSIPMGACESTSTSTAFTATVPGITELRDGVVMCLTNGVVTSAAGYTININGLGAKPVYASNAAATASTTAFNAAYTVLFIYNSSRVTGGCWDYVYGYDSNTTYTPVKLGFGYATCSTAEATTAKTASMSSYALTAGGIVSIKFTNAVPANATLNISSKGAKAIYYRGAAITAGVIGAGDTATFVYSTYYHLISIDRAVPTKTSELTNDSGFLTQHQDISGKADKTQTVTVSTGGAVTQALDAGKIYVFTGALTSLTLTFNTPSTGDLAQYHFIFSTGSTAPTLTLPSGVMMPDGWSVEADKRYEVDILDGYGVAVSWAVTV